MKIEKLNANKNGLLYDLGIMQDKINELVDAINFIQMASEDGWKVTQNTQQNIPNWASIDKIEEEECFSARNKEMIDRLGKEKQEECHLSPDCCYQEKCICGKCTKEEKKPHICLCCMAKKEECWCKKWEEEKQKFSGKLEIKQPEIKCDCNCHYPERLVLVSHSILECPGCHGKKDAKESFKEAKKVIQPEILPCLWCHKIPELYQSDYLKEWYVMCMNIDCLMKIYTSQYKTKQEAVSAWNRRAK